jgi:hypothetical protein
MKQLKLMLGDRARRQRGSVLSGLLIIVAFLSILIGALMTELTTSFLISRSHTARVAREATVTSAVELATYQLQTSVKNNAVPPRCVSDARGPWNVTLNGSPAFVTPSCVGVVPDLAKSLVAGAFDVDGTHELVRGRNSYLVGDHAGYLHSYPFGQTSEAWSIATGGLTAPPLAKADPTDSRDVAILVPSNSSGFGCRSHCVELWEESGGIPVFICAMPASNVVGARPASEMTNFPTYAFFGDTGGNLYIFDATTDGECDPRRSLGGLGGSVVGDPLVFPGPVYKNGALTNTNDDVFVVVSGTSSTQLMHWRYTEVFDTNRRTIISMTWSQQESPIPILVGNTAGYAISSTAGPTMTLAFAGVSSGQFATARISVAAGSTYGMSGGSALPPSLGPVSRAPYWCPARSCGQDLIGVGSTNGTLYLLNSSGQIISRYDGQSPINTTPSSDAIGNWYFGADDGYTYEVEPRPGGGQMFKAARFGPGGAIRSSPVVGGGMDGCGPGPCMYFGSLTNGAYFAQLGNTRLLDLRACVSDGSTTCTVNPRLWARVVVGSPIIVGGNGVKVLGWSYYAP